MSFSPTTSRLDLRDDRAWLDGFRKGNADALERVFRRYQGLVFFLVRRAPGSRYPDHVDLVQEVFARAFKLETRLRYDGLHPYMAFLRGISRLVVLEWIRRRGAAETLLEEVDLAARAVDGWEPGAPLPQDILLEKEEQELMVKFMATLSADEQRFVYRRFRDGLSQREAAEDLGLSRQNIRTAEEHVRAKLAEFLKIHGIE